MTNAATKLTLAGALEKIRGCALSSVEFVMDYVQFWFDGACLTAFPPPAVDRGSGILASGERGYRDLLCGQIGCLVERTEVNDQRVTIAFEGGAAVSISLLDHDYRGPEALQSWLDKKDCFWVV
jgi:hypothetical protein